MIGATDIFVSYKAEDRPRLVPLVSALEAEGFSVWWDIHIGAGAHWREDIQEHLDAAKCVIVVWTRRSVGRDGDFVRDEATRARKRGAYLPIRFDATEPPLGFGEVQALSLKGWQGERSDPRFRAIVEAVQRRMAGQVIDHVSLPHDHYRVSRRAVIAGGATAAAVAGVGGWLLLRPDAANARRIAVLPFADLSPTHDQAYFTEGLSEELRGALSRIGLEVIGRASSGAVKELDTKAAASKLEVGYILNGSVRRSPQLLRISAQLVRGSDGVEQWTQGYDRAPGDEIKIQTDIAIRVAQALSLTLGKVDRTALELGGTSDSAAQDLYLKASAIALKGEDPLREAIALLDAAIKRDPAYANAFRLKARLLELLGTSYPKSADDMAARLAQAEQAARRAIALAPTLGSAYATLAIIDQDRFRFADAKQHIDKAFKLSPEDPGVLSSAFYLNRYLGDPHDALQIADRLIALDPLEGVNYTLRADVLLALRQYPQAIQAARRSLELKPRPYPHQQIGDALVLMNQPVEARAEYQEVPADDVFRMAGEAIIEARARNPAAVERIVAQMRESFGDAASYNYAQVHAQAGDRDRAFAALNKALKVKDPGLTGLRTDPFMDPIRRDPRYDALLKQLNFPAVI